MVHLSCLPTARKRSIYDQVGEEGLKGHGGSGYTFQGDPMNIFAQFFGREGMFSGASGGQSGGFSFAGQPGSSFSFMRGGAPGMFFGQGGGSEPMDFTSSGGMFTDGGGIPSSRQRKQDPPVEHALVVSLEDLFHGCTKKMKISRKILNSDGTSSPQENLVTINVKPGWKAGTKITFAKEGDQHVGRLPADIVFTVEEKPHKQFTRDGNNLVYTAHLSLREALCGGTHLQIPTIEGGHIPMYLSNVTTPDTVKTIPGQGMPISKRPGHRGDLMVKFHIEFPTQLSADSKESISRALP